MHFNIRKSRSQLTPSDEPVFTGDYEKFCEGLDTIIY